MSRVKVGHRVKRKIGNFHQINKNQAQDKYIQRKLYNKPKFLVSEKETDGYMEPSKSNSWSLLDKY